MNNIKDFEKLEKTNFKMGIKQISEWNMANCDNIKDKIKVKNEIRKARKSLKSKSRGDGMVGYIFIILLFVGLGVFVISPFVVHIAWNVLLGYAFPSLIFLGYWQRVAVGLAMSLLSDRSRSSK